MAQPLKLHNDPDEPRKVMSRADRRRRQRNIKQQIGKQKVKFNERKMEKKEQHDSQSS